MTSLSRVPSPLLLLPPIILLIRLSHAHGGHDKIPEGAATSDDPLDGILWTHILLMVLSFGLIYPTGMVLGMVRSRWHVPLQILGTVIAIPAYFMGHMHKGRQFAKPHIHATFANSLVLMTIVQVGIGVGLKLHLEEKRGWLGKVFGGKTGRGGRRIVVIAHGVIGKAMPVVSWTQMLFGGIVALGHCRQDHLGQCLAHFIMGSAFIGYGIVMTILLLVGQGWLRRTGKSQEFFDSILISAWGCVNTFTEHRWGQPWAKNDLQHTSMGIVWWCAGLLGIWLSRSRNGRPRRNVLPGIVIMITGWAMSAHPQDIPLSTMVHSVFGYTLMAAGATRIIEISFMLKDSRGNTEPSSWQHLPPFLLYASGLLFLSATEQQMSLLSNHSVSHVSYILIIYSAAFLMYLFVQILLHIYATHTWGDDESNGLRGPSQSQATMTGARSAVGAPGRGARGTDSGPGQGQAHSRQINPRLAGTGTAAGAGAGAPPYPMGWHPNPHSRKPTLSNLDSQNSEYYYPYAYSDAYSDSDANAYTNGNPNANVNGNGNGNVRIPPQPGHRGTASQVVRDAEEFELEGLMSEDGDGDGDSPTDSGSGRRKEGDIAV